MADTCTTTKSGRPRGYSLRLVERKRIQRRRVKKNFYYKSRNANKSMIVAGSDEVKTVSRFSTTTTDRYKNRIRNRSTGSLPIFLGRRYTGILDMLSLWRSLFARAGLDVRDTTKPSSPSDRTECRRPSPCPCIHGGPCSAAPRSLDLSRLERSCPSSCPTPCNAHK